MAKSKNRNTSPRAPKAPKPEPEVAEAKTEIDPEIARRNQQVADQLAAEEGRDDGFQDGTTDHDGDGEMGGRARVENQSDPGDEDPDAPPSPDEGDEELVIDVEPAEGEADEVVSAGRKPIVGEPLHFFTNERRAGLRDKQPRAAICTRVNEDGTVALVVFDVDAQPRSIARMSGNRNNAEYWAFIRI